VSEIQDILIVITGWGELGKLILQAKTAVFGH